MTTSAPGPGTLEPDLERRAGALLGDDIWAVADVTPDEVRVATHRCGPDDDLEIGSISKGLTALLYVDAQQRGEVTSQTRLREHLPGLDGSAVGDVALGALAVHRSGLPSLPAQAHMTRRTVSWLARGTNPYGDTLEELVPQARATSVGRPRAVYSNLGFQLLGHAVAAAAGASYRDLLAERLSGPLGLTAATVPSSPDELGPHAVVGQRRFLGDADPWTGEALGPAGGVRLSITDAATVAQALLTGQVPGVAALDPTTDFTGRMRIGAAWITTSTRTGPVTWHNGGTGGFRTWLGLDRERGRAVVVLRGRARSVDRAGLRLLAP